MRYISLIISAASITAVCYVGTATPIIASENGTQPIAANTQQAIRKAADRSVRLIERTSAQFLKTRTCFTCHTQTLSAIVLRTAHKKGFDVDEQNIKRQAERAFEFHNLVKSRKPAGIRVDTVGYGLWALDIGQHAPDSMTEDMTWYLLNFQKELGHWTVPVDRPPAQASDFTTNYVAIRGLNRYGTKEQESEIAQRATAVKRWLKTAEAVDTEDQVFRLRLFNELKMNATSKKPLVERLIREQHEDGGWAQKAGMKSDAYATGSVLVALRVAGNISDDNTAWQRGLAYLLRTQLPDGSWYVATRAKPEQVYFESGFPHGEDQFISAFATGWAAEALLLALPTSEPTQILSEGPTATTPSPR